NEDDPPPQPVPWQLQIPLVDGGTVLHAAVESGSTDAVVLILQSGADIEAKDSKGRTPLMLAESLSLLSLLVTEWHADTSVRDVDGYCLWHYHATENDHQMLQWLAANDPHKSASLKAVSRPGRTPLLEALGTVSELAKRLKSSRTDDHTA